MIFSHRRPEQFWKQYNISSFCVAMLINNRIGFSLQSPLLPRGCSKGVISWSLLEFLKHRNSMNILHTCMYCYDRICYEVFDIWEEKKGWSVAYAMYRMRAIITRGLCFVYPNFHCGLYLRAVYTAARSVFTWFFFHLNSPQR